MKKVNLGIALSLISGAAVVHATPTNTAAITEQQANQTKVLVKPDVQSKNLLIAQDSRGGEWGAGGG